VANVPFKTGASGVLVVAAALCIAIGGVWRAVFHNNQYQFTTWRWGRFFVALILLGAMMKLVILRSGLVE
jgi:hypothetical protein